jgi:3-dehydroquinate synthase
MSKLSQGHSNSSIWLYFISGPPGVGKSTISPLLANLLGGIHLDLDQWIEETQHCSITQMITRYGIEYFRQQELKAIKFWSTQSKVKSFTIPHIISLGGGCVINRELRQIMKSHGKLITLWDEYPAILDRVLKDTKNNRPLLGAPIQEERLLQLMFDRFTAYRDCSDWCMKPKTVHTTYAWAQHIFESIQEPNSQVYESINTSNDSTRPLIDHIPLIDLKHLLAFKVNHSQNSLATTKHITLCDYPISIQHQVPSHIFDILLHLPYTKFIICDSLVYSLYVSQLSDYLTHSKHPHVVLQIERGEKSKSFTVLQKLITCCLENNITRNDYIVAIGGGVVGDLSGFLASIILRGIQWIQIPTTLLAQVDSSVGGKTAINHDLGKNLIGSFYPPSQVYINTFYLNTLAFNEVAAGWVESIKHALIDSMSLLQRIEVHLQHNKYIPPPVDLLVEIISVKARIVHVDEKENGIRAYLNLGHTLGHVLEHTHARLNHGAAVGLGLCFILEWSELYHGLCTHITQRVLCLLKALDLDIDWRSYCNFDLYPLLSQDKKRIGKELKLIVLSEIASLKIEKIELDLFYTRFQQILNRTL